MNEGLLKEMLQQIYGDGKYGQSVLKSFAKEIESASKSPELTQKILDGFETL